MNLFKRAITSIIRNSGKTIVLLFLIFILGSVIAGAISVYGAIHNTDANLRRNMRPIVSIGVDSDAFLEYQNSFDFVTTFPSEHGILLPEVIRSIGQLEQVSFYDYVIHSGLWSLDLIKDWASNPGTIGGLGMDTTFFNLHGTNHTELIQVEQGAIHITQGRQFETHEHIPSSEPIAAIVSKAFADLNNLSLNSLFTLHDWYQEPTHNRLHQPFDRWEFENNDFYIHLEFEFEIVGIFELDERIDEADYYEAWDRWHHQTIIYIPNWAAEEINRQRDQALISVHETFNIENPFLRVEEILANPISARPIFILDDPLYIDDFKEAAEPYLPRFMIIDDLSRAFDSIASSMVTLRSIADGVLWAALGATLLILSLLITLFLRDRRYEMGVYLALGEKKGKIIFQILTEVLVISFIAITMSIFVGNVISAVVSHSMLIGELTIETSNDPFSNFSPRGALASLGFPINMSVDDMMEQFDISLTIRTISLFYIVGLGTVVLSTIAPVVYVVKLNPKEILLRGNIG